MRKANYEQKCKENEELQAKHNSFNIQKKVKGLANTTKHKQLNLLYDNLKTITEIKQKLEIYKHFIV